MCTLVARQSVSAVKIVSGTPRCEVIRDLVFPSGFRSVTDQVSGTRIVL